MRYAGKIDANQPEIVSEFRKMGAVVDIVSHVRGLGYDLIVGFQGQVWIVEVKDGSLPPSRRALTESEYEAALRWGRRYAVVSTTDEAINLLMGH